MSGIKHGGQQPKRGKGLKAGSKKKRFKDASESQAKYHAAIAARRAKKKKK